MFEDPYLKSIKTRIEEPANFIQVILGSIQIGKTIMVTLLSIPNLNESVDTIAATNSSWLV